MSGRTRDAEAPKDALLILGPTGSGKSPLGDLLEIRGLRGRTCHHFDFGGRLRQAAEASLGSDALTAGEVEHVRSLLARGALLEDDRFAIAEKILRGFLRRRGVGSTDLVILNGLPRHVGQATALEPTVDVRIVVCLVADADTIRRRIEIDAGGDRAGRVDDEPAQVGRKLQIYEARTRPLLQWYAARGASSHAIPVGVETSSEEVYALLSKHCDR